MFRAARNPSTRALLTTAGVALLTVVVSVGSGGLVVFPFGPPLDPVVGLAVPLGLLAGLPAAAGIVLGLAVTALLGGAFAWVTVVELLAVGTLAATGYGLWGVLPVVARGDPPGLTTVGPVVEFLAVAVVASVTAVSVLAWGSVYVQSRAFHGVVVTELPITLASTLVTGPLVLVPAGLVWGEDGWKAVDDGASTGESESSRAVVVVPFLWLVGGSLYSIAARIVQSIGENTLLEYGYGVVFTVFDPGVVGDGGRQALVVGGAVLSALLVATWLPLNHKSREPGSQTTESRDT